MPYLAPRPWVPATGEALIARIATETASPSDRVADRIETLIAESSPEALAPRFAEFRRQFHDLHYIRP